MNYSLQDPLLPNPPKGMGQLLAMAAAFDHTPDALFLLSRSATGYWEFGSGNRAACELFGIAPDQLLGKTLQDIFGKEALQENGRFLADICAENGETLERDAYLAARSEDLWVEFNWWHFKFVPIPNTTGHIEQVAGICRLITETKQLQASLQKFSTAIDQASSIIAIIELDGSIEYINPAFETRTGFPRNIAIGKSILQFCMPPEASSLYAPMIAAMNEGKSWESQLPSKKQDGSVYWEDVRVSPIRNDKDIATHFLLIKEDITEKRTIESQLKLASLALETTDAGVIITDAQTRIISVNPAFTRTTGYTEAESLGRTPKILSSGTHDHAFYQSMWRSLKTNGRWQGELIDRKKNGDIYVQNISISALHDEKGELSHYVGVFSDITALKDSQHRMESIANFDALTRLPNRYRLLDRLEHALLRAKRERHNVALIYFDLDNFKAVNDTLGHPAGDALLKEVSARALRQLRNEDTLARLGGDEFVAVLEGIDMPERIAVVAERIIEAINLPFTTQGHEMFVGCSMGIAFFPKDGPDVDTLMRNADLALYRAKEEGKNCYRLYSEEMNAKAHTRYQLEMRLRKAIESKELSLVYQPQFNTRSRQLVGAEVLLRWSNQDIGSISPVQFIPIAEQTGLIVPIGRWVIEQVCHIQKIAMEAGHLLPKIAINVSPVQFRQKGLVDLFQQILADTGVPANCIEVEVTEGAIMADAEKAIEILGQLRDMGLSIAIDDFGTGYSSLGYLKRFPIDKIKIDRTFVNELETDPDDAVIISAIIAMSHSLGIKTLAEGVETDQQLEYLHLAGCDEIQGYLLGKPVPLADFQEIVRQHSHA